MATYVPAKRATAYIEYVHLQSATAPNDFQANPTLASGDVKVSIDGGAFANLTTLPVVTPASGRAVKVSLSASEMTGDNIVVEFVDQTSPKEWADYAMHIQTAARQIDDLAYPATSGRSMVVDASGLVDANAVKVGPSGSGTAQTAGDIIGDTNDIQTRLPAALVSGRIDASVGAMASGVVTATAIAADAITDAKVASDVTIASVTGAVGSVTGNVGGNVAGSVGSVTAGVTLAASAVQAIWDALTSALTTVGSIGKLLVDNIDAAISSRLASGSYTAPDNSSITAIKAKTDNLPSDPADASVIAARFDTLDTSVADLPTNAELATALGTADDAVLAQVALVKAQTDLIPSDPADASVIAARFDTLDTNIADLPTNAELATALGTADDAVLAQIALVKAKTDSLTFTVAGVLDANIQYVNDVQVNGVGTAGDPWSP